MTPAAKSPLATTVGLLICGAAAVALTGCKPGAPEAAAQAAPPPLAALPLSNSSAPQTQPGPVAVDLPNARPARLGPLLDAGDGYAYLDRAYFLNDAFADAPPDYGFDYADEEMPWVWRTDDGFLRLAEFLPYGARYYYYEPGEDYPFLIADPDYDYAYADGELVAVYDSGGALLPPEDLTLHAPLAGRELARAQRLFRGAGRDQQPVALSAWTARRSQISSDLVRWRGLESHQAAWRTYHQQHLSTEQAHFAPERFRRAAETARVDRQIHDPDGADHAMRELRQAQDVARRAHMNLPIQPHRPPPGAANAPAARMAAATPGFLGGPRPPGLDRQMARAGRLRADSGAAAPAPAGPRFEGGPQGRFAAAAPPRLTPAQTRAESPRAERLAQARTTPEPRAQFNFRDRTAERGPAAFSTPRLRAAEQARPPEPQRAVHNFAPAMAARRFQPSAETPRPQPAPHLQIVQAAPQHGGGGGDHPAPPPSRPGNDRHH